MSPSADARAFAQPEWIEAVPLQEQVVEAPHAAEPGRGRDDGHRQRGIGQQPLGHQQPVRLRELDRRHTELRAEDPAQVAFGHADTPCERIDGMRVQETVLDQRGGRVGERAGQVEQPVAGRAGRQRMQGRKPAFSAAAALG